MISTTGRARTGAGATGAERSFPPDDVRPWVGVVVFATALAAVLGLIELGGPALSYDEAYTVAVVHGPFADTWMRVTNWDMVQAPYYLLFSLWYEVGESEALLRLPSVAFYVASVPLVFALGRRLLDARVGAVAAVLLALNALALDWAQQARSYSMALFLVSLSSYLLARAVDRPSAARSVAYGLVSVVAVYAQFLVGLVLVAHVLSLLVRRPTPWQVILVGGGTIAALTGPAAIWVLTLRSDPLSWIARPSLRDAMAMIGDVSGGALPQLVVLGALAGIGAYAGWECQRRAPGSIRAWGLALAVVWLALPVVVLVVSTYTVKPLLHPRYLIIVVPAFTLLAAAGLVWVVDRVGRAVAVGVAGVALVVAVAGAATHYAYNTRHEWRTATAMVLDDAQPGDSLVVVPWQSVRAVDYYQRRLPGPEVPALQPNAGDPPAGPRLWVVDRVRDVEMDTEAWNPMPTFEQWRDEHYELVDEREASENIAVRLYHRRS